MAVNTDDLVQASMETRQSHPDLSYTTVAVCTVYNYLFLPRR